MRVIYDKCNICKDYEYIKLCKNCNNILVCYLCMDYINYKCSKCNQYMKK